MRTCALVRAASITLTVAGIATLSARAHATIVFNGKEVPAWPDLEPPSPPPGVALDTFGATGINLFPHPTGSVHGLTILVDFSDQTGAYSKAEVTAWLNTKGYDQFGLTGSVRDYYLKQSNGKVDYQNEVHGFYRATKPKSYYQAADGYARADELWEEVSAALDSEIDYSQFDNDKDGKTEAISLLYAGDEGTFGKGLWPHASSSNDMRDGVRLNRYMMTAMDAKPTNYVFSHESGHMLFGWPDLYGVGDYSIMANRDADTNPVGIDDVLRADQGWIDVVDIQSTTNARYQAVPNGVAYRYLNPARPTEYFLWSNVQNVGEWSSLAGGGLLVWHFDKSIGSNTPPQPLELAVVQGGGTRILSATTWPSPGSAKTDFFRKDVNAELAAATTPASKWNNGSASGLRIYDIGASGSSIAFSVGVGPITDGGSGGASGGGASSGGASSAGASGGGASSAGASSGGASSGGASSGGASSGGASSGGASGGSVAGASGAGTAGNSAVGSAGAVGVSGAAGSTNATGSAGNAGASPSGTNDAAGCSCSSAPRSGSHGALALGLAAMTWCVTRRRRHSRA
ncbi:MAG: M6 family metalloprotease domain-containing protein [Polyangiaceae bacterium]